MNDSGRASPRRAPAHSLRLSSESGRLYVWQAKAKAATMNPAATKLRMRSRTVSHRSPQKNSRGALVKLLKEKFGNTAGNRDPGERKQIRRCDDSTLVPFIRSMLD